MLTMIIVINSILLITITIIELNTIDEFAVTCSCSLPWMAKS